MALISSNNVGKPAPKWFRVFNVIYGNTETLVLTILMMNGFSDSSKLLLEIKLASSFIRTNLGVLLGDGEEYAPAGTTQALQSANGNVGQRAASSDTVTKTP